MPHGGAGNDILSGGTGADTFVWTLADANSATAPVDRVTDLFENAGDRLDLKDLLVDEHGSGSGANLADYLHFTSTNGGADTTIAVSSHAGGAAGVDQIIVLEGVNMADLGANDSAIISNLLAANKLNVDA